MKEIAYSKAALKVLRRIGNTGSARIRSKIAQYAEDPASQANNVKRLQGSPNFRLWVGDWRAIFNEQGQVLAILNIGPRGGIYD